MAKWFYYNGTGAKIEVTGGQLKCLAKAGKITPETIVETDDGEKSTGTKGKGADVPCGGIACRRESVYGSCTGRG